MADQWTKAWAGRHTGPAQALIAGLCEVRPTSNHGAVGGLFADSGSGTLAMVLVSCGGVVSLLLLRLTLRAPGIRPSLGVGLMLGGVLGNTIDRLRWGYVVDFIYLRVGDLWQIGTLNAADLAIVAGLALLIPEFLRPQRAARLPRTSTPGS